MRHRFRRRRFVHQRSSRRRWLPDVADVFAECRDELALIAEWRRSQPSG